jgi:tRNA G37 N-methylase Trm5
MLKRINSSLYIVNDKKEKIIVNLDNDGIIVGDYKIRGNVSEIWGDVSNIEGNVSKIKGDVTCLVGDVNGVSGNVDKAIKEYLKKNNLTKLEDKIDISLLIG